MNESNLNYKPTRSHVVTYYISDNLYVIVLSSSAFLWCILSTTNDMHLKEISTISLAESLYEKGLYNLLTYLEIGATKINMEGMFLAFSVEIHNWLLFLHNNGKLKGIYDRFTGFYKVSE